MKKEFLEPIILIGGDFNMTKLDNITEIFQDTEEAQTEPTCNGRKLDKIITDLDKYEARILAP